MTPFAGMRWQDIAWDDVTRDVDVDGKRIRLVDLGSSASDEVVVFLHGVSASWRWFAHILPTVARSRRAIAMDLPGFGDSHFSRAHIGFSALARAVAETCAALGVRNATFVGHSMGSIVATRLAIDSPGLVDRLVITGGPILSLTGLARNPMRTFVDQPRSVITLLAELATIGLPVPSSVARLVATSPALLKLVLGPFVEKPENLDPDVMVQVMSALGAPGTFPTLLSAAVSDPSVDLFRIACPAHIIHGPGDPLSPPADVARFLQEVPMASVVEIDGTGHWPHIEKPARFLAELDAFLGTPHG
jgi:3-oxoadipate enol-lactonase